MNLEEAILRAGGTRAKEECGELIVALCHYRLGRLHGDHVREEIADVLFMALQQAEVFGSEAVADVLARKADRALWRVREEREKERVKNENLG